MKQAASAADGAGLGIFAQDSDVLNLGVAVANSGGNLALGNVSGNLAANGQGAFGLIASNNGSATNASNGSAVVRTGAANAQGNTSTTNIDQGINADPPAYGVDPERSGRERRPRLRQLLPQRRPRQRHAQRGDPSPR